MTFINSLSCKEWIVINTWPQVSLQQRPAILSYGLTPKFPLSMYHPLILFYHARDACY